MKPFPADPARTMGRSLALSRLLALLLAVNGAGAVLLVEGCSGSSNKNAPKLVSLADGMAALFPPPPTGVVPIPGADWTYQSLGVDVVRTEGGWYARAAVRALAMQSGSGVLLPFPPADQTAILALANDAVSSAAVPAGLALLERIFDRGDPRLANAYNGDPTDYTNFRWGSAIATTTSREALGFALLAELALARKFHQDLWYGVPASGDAIPGAAERLDGLLAFVSALGQFDAFVADPTSYGATTAGNYALLWAASDLYALLAPSFVPHSTQTPSRYRLAAEIRKAPQTADAVAAGILAQADALYAGLATPATLREHAVAVQALAAYSTHVPTNHQAARVLIPILADRLHGMQPATPAERGHSMRGLVEAYRLTGDRKYLTKAGDHLATLESDYRAGMARFGGQTAYTTDDAAAIIGGLGALVTFAEAPKKDDAARLLHYLFEGFANRSGLVPSAPPGTDMAGYERVLVAAQMAKPFDPIFLRYPTVPDPRQAPGPNGTAPAFAAEIDASGEIWAALPEFDTAGGMHLAAELFWLQRDQIDGFPPRVPNLRARDAEYARQGFAATQWLGYWYSRYNLDHLAMRSSNGNAFMPAPALVTAMETAASDDLSAGTANVTVVLLDRVYDSGDPSFASADDGDPADFTDNRWFATGPPATTDPNAAAWLMVKEIEWARLFHVDAHFGIPVTPNQDGIPGAMGRLAGMVLFVEAYNQYLVYRNSPGLFGTDLAGRYAVLEAVSDLGLLLSERTLKASSGNRYRAVVEQIEAPRSADAVAADVLAFADTLYLGLPQPATLRERSIATQALAWYMTASPTNAKAARNRLIAIGDGIAGASIVTAADRGHAIRGLVETYRATGDPVYRRAAASLFDEMASDYDGFLGYFRSQTTYTSDETGVILGALNALRLFGGSDADAEAVLKLLQDWFESAVNRGALQISAPPTSEIPAFEKRAPYGADVFFRYPLLPLPGGVPGTSGFGTAPVFAASSTINPATAVWTPSSSTFDTSGAMHLATEMVWFHDAYIDGFPGEIPPPPSTGGGGSAPPDGGGGGGGGGVSFASQVQPVFTANCSCHLSPSAPMGENLSAGASYGTIVGVPSTEVPSTLRINPGNPDLSYLIQKVEGTAAVGDQMPLGGPPLPAATIQTLRTWVSEGAQNN